MNHSTQDLQISIHKVDGSIATFTQSDALLIGRILAELQPARIFNQKRIAVAGDNSAATFSPSLITRVDLMTDQLSVWDFPFVVGALLELTDVEFHEFLREQQQRLQTHPAGDFPVFFDIEIVNHQRVFLWMQVVAGFPPEQLPKACSRLKEQGLVFGLRTGGIGILNPANLLRFLVHLDPLNRPAEVGYTHQLCSSRFDHPEVNLRESMVVRPTLSCFLQDSRK